MLSIGKYQYSGLRKVVIKKILLAADLSVYTPSVLQHSTDLANQYNANLVIVHAVEPLGSLGHALLQAYLKPETSREITTKGLDAMVKEVKAHVVDYVTDQYMDGDSDLSQLEDIVVEAGNPSSVILKTADEIDADIILVGCHSPDIENTNSLGSVAQKVINGAKVPVYVVPCEHLFWRKEDTNNQMGLW
jgi:nucleotide-binding universal stress UspA family protein